MPDPAEPQAEVLRFFGEPRTHGLEEPVKRIDTAGAVVFLAGADAYKVKRAVKFPFMDLSTLDRRRRACEAEIAVNRDNAPDIYLEALPIVRRGAGLAIGRAGDPVEWAVHMRRFDETATLDRLADRGGVPEAVVDRLAQAIRRSHARAPLRDAGRAAEEIATYIEQNDAAFAELPELFPRAKARRLTHDSRLAFAIARPVLLARGAAGFTRRCHGDLHLSNIVLIDGEPTLFDAVEFSDEVASGDVLYDLAFLLMDLEERGLRAAVNRLFNAYLAPEPPEALAGLAALPLFMSLRAAIRAKVEAAGADRLDGAPHGEALTLARRYFDSAADFLRYVPPRLVAVGGLSGAGKSARAATGPRARRAHASQRRRAQSDVGRRRDHASARFGLCAGGYARRLPADRRQGPARFESRARCRTRRDIFDGAGAPRRERRPGRSRRRLRRPFSRGPARDPARAGRRSRGRRVGCGRVRRAQPARRAAWRKGLDRTRRRRRAERNGGAGSRPAALPLVIGRKSFALKP